MKAQLVKKTFGDINIFYESPNMELIKIQLEQIILSTSPGGGFDDFGSFDDSIWNILG